MKIGEILKDKESEGREKHVPVIEVLEDAIEVVVGKEVPHPNTTEHHIAWIEVYGMKKDGGVVDLGRAAFAPGFTGPKVRFQVPLVDFKAFCALSYCNIHGLWENCIEVA